MVNVSREPIGLDCTKGPLLGLGTVKFGRNQCVKYPKLFNLPSSEGICNLINVSYESGYRIIDTAPAYGLSEYLIGRCMKYNRRKWILGTKAGEQFINGKSSFDFSEGNIQKSVFQSLDNLNTNYLDYVLLHSNGDDCSVLKSGGLSALQQLKQKGLIKAIGISSKTQIGALAAIEMCLDVVMMEFDPSDASSMQLIQKAKSKKTSILLKKVLSSGHSDPRAILPLLKGISGVSGVIVGSIDEEHIKSNAKLFFNVDKI